VIKTAANVFHTEHVIRLLGGVAFGASGNCAQ